MVRKITITAGVSSLFLLLGAGCAASAKTNIDPATGAVETTRTNNRPQRIVETETTVGITPPGTLPLPKEIKR